jgi:AcrR family transcriptional regulator
MNKDQLIIVTALKLFVENGFHGTATSKIAQESGVANGTLFNYFGTKEILIVEIYNSIIKKKEDFIIQSIESHSVSKESFRSLFIASLYWNLENAVDFQYLQQFNSSPYSKSAIMRTSSNDEQPLYVLIQKGIDLVVLKAMPAAFIFSLFTAHINGLYYYLISENIVKEHSVELINETFEIFWKIIED